MMKELAPYILPLAVALLLSLVLTPVVRLLARRVGMVAKPKIDRWHKKPTALLDGVAIFAAAALESTPPFMATAIHFKKKF